MDAVERTQSWREQKREQGYRPLTVWLPAALKARIEDLAYTRHQEVAELIAEAFTAWQPFQAGKKAALTDRRQIQAMIQEEISKALRGEPPAPDEEPLPMRQCKQGHAPYAGHREECPECVRLRKQKSRARKRDKAKAQQQPPG